MISSCTRLDEIEDFSVGTREDGDESFGRSIWQDGLDDWMIVGSDDGRLPILMDLFGLSTPIFVSSLFYANVGELER